MTIAIGILLQDGLIMGADTEETGESLKRNVSKIPEYGCHDAVLFVAGAGPASHVETMTELLQKNFKKLWSKNFEAVETEFRKTIKAYYKDHILSWPSMLEREDNDFELLVGAYIPQKETPEVLYSYPYRLWISQQGILRNIAPPCHSAIGKGRSYACSLFDDYLPSDITSEAANILVAIFTLHKVKRDTPNCGKETQLSCVFGGTSIYIAPPLIAQGERLIQIYQQLEKEEFVQLVEDEKRRKNNRLVPAFPSLSRELQRIKLEFAALRKDITEEIKSQKKPVSLDDIRNMKIDD